MKKTIIISLLILIVLSSPVLADKTGHITLLTVAESGEERIGGTADLKLEIKRGSGRIFIDSFPLTKIDTQISTRFANEITCKYFDLDCSEYDFFYTIKADSSIVGGPSAGAGIAVLTASVMKDLDMKQRVAITGTINAGGIIGPVAGVEEKVSAAQERDLNKVIIPRYSSFNKSEFRKTTGKELTTEVVKVGNLNEAIYEVTGKRFERASGEIEVSQRYQDRMEAVADLLCNRTTRLEEQLEDINESEKENFTAKKERAFNRSNYYTGASYCFTRNINLRQRILEDGTQEEKKQRVQELTDSIEDLNDKVDERSLATLSDLETYMIVKERLVDASQTLKDMNLTNTSSNQLGYVVERYFSAVAWSQFFGLGGTPYTLEKDHLREACIKKLSEAEERVDYVNSINSEVLTDTREELGLARQDKNRGDYALCVFKASKVKAEADMFLLGITVGQGAMPNVIEEKLATAKNVILEQQERGIFPILGYSYYEYADVLKNENPASALLFAEYSLEMSNLDLYFPQEETGWSFELPRINTDFLVLFLSGLLIGFVLGATVKFSRRDKD